MERIEFTYFFDSNGTEHHVCSSKKDTDNTGLNTYDICEMFEQFMISVGFSEESIVGYFNR